MGVMRRLGGPLLLGAVIVVGSSGGDVAAGQGGDGGRPNVIVVMTDDQTQASLAKMPRVNSELVAQGATFANSFTNWPLCCPSRATFYSGQYAHNHRVLGNAPPDGGFVRFNDSNALPVWLQSAGYRTIHVGKFLNYYGQPPYFEPSEVPPGWSNWQTLIGEDSTHFFYGYRLNVNGTIEGPFGDIAYERRDPAGCPTAPPPDEVCTHQTDVLTQRAVDQVLGSGGEQPFFLSLDYVAPHGDYRAPWGAEPAPRHYDSLITLPLPRPPGFNERDVSDKPRFLRRAGRLGATAIANAQQEWQKGLESLRAVDDGVGRVLEALAATGELGSTYVFFTTDNGFFAGEHRIQRSKFLPYEPSAHVPLLLRGPGIAPGGRSGELVANLDLAPTILQIAGAAPGNAIDGRSLLRFSHEPGRRTSRPLLLEGFTRAVDVATARAGAETSIRDAPVRDYQGIRVGRYKYVRYAGGGRELYDLRLDPHELHSRVADPRYREARAFLGRRLNWLRRCAGYPCRRPLVARIPGPGLRSRPGG